MSIRFAAESLRPGHVSKTTSLIAIVDLALQSHLASNILGVNAELILVALKKLASR